MLTYLKIQNLALVDSLYWEPRSGFMAITGETGAGKSVIIGAIKLALGERAEKSLIRSGEQACSVEVVFSIPSDSPIHAKLEEHGISPCEDGCLMIRRHVTSSSNRQFVNDSPCTLSLLRDMGDYLVDMHSPDEHRSLTSSERQLSLLDSFAEGDELVAQYHQAWRSFQDAKNAYADLSQAEAATEREVELLRHQIEEISGAELSLAESVGLEERWMRAKNSSKLRENSSKMFHLLSGAQEVSIVEQFNEFIRSAHELERMDPSSSGWLTSVQVIDTELKELEEQLGTYVGHLDGDPEELASLEERINVLESLKRKYGPQIEDVLARLDEATERLDQIEHRTEKLASLKAEVETTKSLVDQLATKLTVLRKRNAPKLAQSIMAHSRELGFKQAGFDVLFRELDAPGAHGKENIEFLFAPNPGEASKALSQIASSGELARVMLAIKSSLADKDDTPLLVFDEIDSNVGGEVARAVGKKMLELGEKHQVISITHFPQVAAMANHHYLVEKAVVKDRSISRIIDIQGDTRVAELVRMLGGGGDEARAHAMKLLHS